LILSGFTEKDIRVKVKDVEFAEAITVVRDGKGNRDRITVLPASLVPALQEQLRHARKLHEFDLAEGYGEAAMPYALVRKYPGVTRSWAWQYLFPSVLLIPALVGRDDITSIRIPFSAL
jgi:integrase